MTRVVKRRFIGRYIGDIETVKHLISVGADVNTKDDGGETPLYEAAYKGHVDIANLLIDACADVNICDYYKRTPLN